MNAFFLLRPASEITIKGPRVRKLLLKGLKEAVRESCARWGVACEFEEWMSRLLLRTDEPDRAQHALERVFGLGSYSRILAEEIAEPERIVARGLELFTPLVAGKSFGVRCRRRGSHDFSSRTIERELGASLAAEAKRVDLRQPEVWVWIEVLGQRVFFYRAKRRGAGGITAGAEGRAVALMSGGFDSAVAAWRILKRGLCMDFVFCNLAGSAYERLVLQVTERLCRSWTLRQRPKLFVVDFVPLLAEIKARVSPSYAQLVLKRLMYRVATEIGLEQGAHVVVTGEALAQVSSQTAANLMALHHPAALPLVRPLVGHDKEEIIACARRIGTAKLSERVKEHCGIAQGRPVTAGRRERLNAEVAKIDEQLLNKALAACRVVDVLAPKTQSNRETYLFVDELPAGARLIDIQPKPAFRQQHAPGAEHWDAGELMAGFGDLDDSQTYVLYCGSDVRSGQLAELMQQSGLDAYAFRGGLRALLKQAASTA